MLLYERYLGSARRSGPSVSLGTTKHLTSSFPTSSTRLLWIEAKITGDDGTAPDKVARIERLTRMRDDRHRAGQPDFEVVACIDGRGFGVRREDMRSLIGMTEGKVFTLATLDQMVAHTRLQEFLPS